MTKVSSPGSDIGEKVAKVSADRDFLGGSALDTDSVCINYEDEENIDPPRRKLQLPPKVTAHTSSPGSNTPRARTSDSLVRSGSFDSKRSHSSIDSRRSNEKVDAAIVEKLSHIPIHVRGRAEAWEIPRSQLQFSKQLGRGTGSTVYMCKWRGLDCAAKLLSDSRVSHDAAVYQEMVNEISIISRLRHPNLVLFLGACTVGNEPLVIVGEYMAGGSLYERFTCSSKDRRGGPGWKPPIKLAMSWIMDLSRAVCFLHGCNIIHRDLKPENLLLSGEDHLKVSDFGLCKTLNKVRADGAPYQMTGDIGTRRYMAPEVIACNPNYDEKVDIYSMGMIFWFIFTGVRPFDGIKPDLVTQLVSIRGARPPTDSIPTPALAGLITRMWAQDPAHRPAAADIVDTVAASDLADAVAADAAARRLVCGPRRGGCALQ